MRIKPEELRIGNWVKWPEEKEPNEVTWQHGHWLGVFEKNYDFPEPIPLTEEWLLKFGFEHDGGSGYKSPHNTEHWYFTLHNEFMPNAVARGGIKSDNYIGSKYVHQLQNLYFSLTGEELIIK